MRTVQFLNPENIPLKTKLSGPIGHISIPNGDSSILSSVTLWYSDGQGVTIRSRMYEIDERTEVGVLDFVPAKATANSELRIDLSVRCKGSVEPNKLIVVESGNAIESGIALRLGDGSEVLIVAGAFPCSLAVRGLDKTDAQFDSEYPLERYGCVAFE